MSQTSRYREQIDACRPGSADLALPALAELAGAVDNDRAVAEELARSHRFDVAVSAAMHDVPLPAGLLERLESKLAEADVTEFAESTGEVSLPDAPARFSRRLVLTSAGLATAAAILLAVASQFWSPMPRRIGRDQLTNAVSQWTEQSAPNSATWKRPSQPAPRVLAVPVKSLRQRNFATSQGEQAVVFDLTPPGGQQVLLFVVQTPHVYDVQNVPYSRLTGVSGGMAVAAWQKAGTLYVLAVREGDRQKLESYIHQQTLAWHSGAARTTRITVTP